MDEIDWAAVEAESAQLLSHYLQFDTSNPPGHEAPATEFLADLLRERGFSPQIFEAAPGRTNLIVSLKSTFEATNPPCLLYTHADVVPAEAERWSVPPFGGKIKDGYVWGRGALDNKGLGIIFLQALTLLKWFAPPLQRDIILVIAADEEVHGQQGIVWLLKHRPELLQAEYIWDEGGVGLTQANGSIYQVAVAEKSTLTVRLVAHGTAGHASVPSRDNAQDRLVRALYRVKQWQLSGHLTPPFIAMLQTLAKQESWPRSWLFSNANRSVLWPLLRPLLERDPRFVALICNTINLTRLKGGQADNVIPDRAEAVLDVRLLPDEDPKAFLTTLRSLIGDRKIAVEVDHLPPTQVSTPIDTPFYQALTSVLHQIDPTGTVTPYLTPGATDSRFFRAVGLKAYGFLPMQLDYNELSRIHGLDERVSTANLRWGTQLVFETLQKL